MWVDVLLLGKLAEGPSHGYELRRLVEESTGFALSNNSLYPALRRFGEAGAVVRESQAAAGRPPRHVYTITDAGRKLLRDMLADLPEERAGDDAEFLARLAHFARLEPAGRLAVLDARARALTSRRDRLTALKDTRHTTAWGRAALDEVARRVDRELRWIDGLRTAAADGGTPRSDPEPL